MFIFMITLGHVHYGCGGIWLRLLFDLGLWPCPLRPFAQMPY